MNVTSFYKLFRVSYSEDNIQIDLHIAAKQIAQEVMISNQIEVYTDLSFIDSDGNENTICLDDNRIVKTPGFEIYAFDVDDLEFECKNNLFYMIVTRDEEDYRFLIGSEINEE